MTFVSNRTKYAEASRLGRPKRTGRLFLSEGRRNSGKLNIFKLESPNSYYGVLLCVLFYMVEKLHKHKGLKNKLLTWLYRPQNTADCSAVFFISSISIINWKSVDYGDKWCKSIFYSNSDLILVWCDLLLISSISFNKSVAFGLAFGYLFL